MFFALSASVISTYSFSILLGKDFKIGIREAILGTIAGGIMYGPVAGTTVNISAPICLGIVAGFISAVYFCVIFPRINKSKIYDSMGLFGNGLIVAFLGTFVLAPIIIRALYNGETKMQTLDGGSTLTGGAAGFVLIYVGISVGIGLASGLFVGLFASIFNRYLQKEFDDNIIFDREYGLNEANIRNHIDRR
jgi:hypothetical protein